MNTLHTVAANTLPDAARELAAIIGMPKTIKLVEALGGTTFPVPKRATKAGEVRFWALSDAVGDDAAQKLCQHYGGVKLYIPRCTEALRNARDRAIIQQFDQETAKGRSGAEVVMELAMQYRLSDRRIWIILKTPEDAPAENTALQQGSLF
jgi:hypothetical protein